MSRLIQVTQNRVGSITHPVAKDRLLGSNKIEQVIADGSAATILYSTRTGKVEHGVDESITDIETAVNAANVTASEQQMITLTVNRLGGYNAATGGFPQTRKVLVSDIFAVDEDADDVNDSVVTLQSGTDQGYKTLFVGETLAAILADANA